MLKRSLDFTVLALLRVYGPCSGRTLVAHFEWMLHGRVMHGEKHTAARNLVQVSLKRLLDTGQAGHLGEAVYDVTVVGRFEFERQVDSHRRVAL